MTTSLESSGTLGDATLSSAARPDGGLDIGLCGQTQVGPLRVGLAVGPQDSGVMGLYASLPSFGAISVCLSRASDGSLSVSEVRAAHDDAPQHLVVQSPPPDERHLLLETELGRARLAFALAEQANSDTLVQLTQARDEARDRAAALVDDVATAQSEIERERQLLERERESLTQYIDRLKAQAEAEKSAHAELAASAEAEHAQLTALRGELERAVRRHTEAEAALQDLSKQKQRLEHDLRTAKGQIEQLRDSVEALETAAASTSTTVQAELDQAKVTIGELQASLQAVSSERATHGGQVDVLSHDLLQERMAHQATREALVVATLKVTEHAKSHSETRASAERDLKQREAALAAREAELTAVANEAQKKAEAASELANRELRACEWKLLELNRQLRAEVQKRQAAEARNAPLLAAQAAAAKAAEDFRTSTEQLERNIALAQAQRDEARAEAKNLEKERDEARHNARASHAKLAHGGSQADSLASELTQLRDALEHERKLAAQVWTQKQAVQSQFESLERLLESERQTRARVQRERDDLKERFESLSSEGPWGTGPMAPRPSPSPAPRHAEPGAVLVPPPPDGTKDNS